jgi:hypothetical protein
MSAMVTIRSNTKALLELLKKTSVAVTARNPKSRRSNMRNKQALRETMEITVTDGKATFAVPGAMFMLDCITYSTCKASISYLHFYDIVKTSKEKVTEIIIKEGEMKIGDVAVAIQSTFFETDRILRTIHLPINYTDADLLRLSKDERYTQEELNINKLTVPIIHAEKNWENNLMAAYKQLKVYGVTYEELEELAARKTYGQETAI